MLPQKTFIYFLLDTPTGKAYYRDSTGTLKIQVITANSDVSLKNAPANWLDTELSFSRNATYHGIARSYSTPQEFVRDAATMIKELFLLGVGTEVPLTLAVFKYNSQPLSGEPQYKLYFKANLDLPKISETVLESLTTNLMEGGVTQLLKSFEGTTLEIPCDGSVAENQKVNLDGLLVPDVFYYQNIPMNDITEVKPLWISISPLPLTFVNNEGDNYGIIHNDQTLEVITYDGSIDPNQIITYSATSTNYLFLSVSKITVTIKGLLPLRFYNPAQVQLFLSTSQGQLIAISDNYFSDNHRIITFNIDAEITLNENEALFLFIQIRNPEGDITLSRHLIDVLNGSLSLSFVSQAKPTRAWAITASDLYSLIVKEICLLASTTNQPFNYEAVSQLLSQNLNLMITSGDALRASGDSSYQRFFSTSQTNNILQTSFGPVIKINLKDFFQSMETILVAELNAGHNGAETLEIEPLESIYDSSVVDFSIGEIASLKWNFAEDLSFSDLEIGYPPQTYDQKAGKYEYNTTLEMKAPIKSFSKKLSKISKIRWDSYGIERLRSNVGTPTSTTRNDSDNSVFGLNVDTSKVTFDYYDASFISTIPDPSNPLNTNINLQQNVSCQPIPATSFDGEYFQPNTDNAIVMFSVVGYVATESCNLTVVGTINSVNKPPLAPTDTFTLKLWHNGLVIYTYTVPVSGVNTPISINYNFSETFAYKDWIYVSMETTASADVTINSAALNIGTYVLMNAANIPVLSGSYKLLSWLSFSPDSKPYTVDSHVQYGFQYFLFNSLVPNTNFTVQAGFTGYSAGNIEIDLIINNSVQALNVNGNPYSGSTTLITRDFALNDLVFLNASIGNYTASIVTANLVFNSTQIKCYGLKRVQYDSLSGIPNLAKDAEGNIRTDISGAPYNIEDLTPKTLYKKWQNYFMSCFMQVTGTMTFQTLSKNSYLSRSVGGQVITENSDEPITGKRLFYPIELEMKTNVPLGFAELMNKTKNAHVHCTFMGTDIYFFADSLAQKPALNESQTWKGILSPKTDLTAFAQINSFKIPDMAPNSLSCAFASPVQFVPYNQVQLAKYHTYNRDTFLFQDQIGNWVVKDNYGQPVQIGDPIPLQFISNGLSNIAYTVYNAADDSVYSGPTNLDVVSSPAVSDPYTLWQQSIDTTSWPRNNYYLVISAADLPVYKSEPLLLRNPIEMEDTVLLEATNSFNTQGIVFDAGFVISMRFKGGFDNKFKQKYLGKFYVDQPQDITVLNAVPYETTTLLIGREGGVPDYVPKKILRMLLMDGCTLDGEGFSINDGAELEEVFTKGAPKKFQKIEIRPSKNKSGINTTPSGVFSDDSSLIVSVNPQSFGPNITNSSGTTETDLINIIVE